VTTERRRAPRRQVVEISREGAWGKVKYKHVLECGHTEIRARAASTSHLACAWCSRAEEKNKEIKALSAGAAIKYRDSDERYISNEISISKTRASLSAKFGVPLESIDVAVNDVNGIFQIQYALVFLSSSDVDRICET
jgi:hypothetical protein